jgi:CheY-like chemotaxis protein
MQAGHPATAGKLIVVVDDDPLVLEAMAGLLETWGYRVIAARSGEAALAQLAQVQEHPHLVVCDYRLARGERGTDTIERLRAAQRVPALLISGVDVPEQERQGIAPPVHLLYKPVKSNDLLATLTRIFGERPGASLR